MVIKFDEERLKKLVIANGKQFSLQLTMEECSELQKECCKLLRFENCRETLIEEMADVIVCIEQLKRHYYISDDWLQQKANEKIYRAYKRVIGD